ncbi:hypothetical protein EUGRSUZ_K02052, partial [Eucalyptus grandis]
IFQKLLLVSFIRIVAWAYKAIQPPQPKIPCSPGGPPVTAPRIKLRDGRHLAYKEHGAPEDVTKFKIVYVHGYYSCRHDAVVTNTFSQSDPDPQRTTKSIALDIEELADQLGFGSKFYIVGYSIGGQILRSCIKYIPHRLAEEALLASAINYWWPGFPSNMSTEAYNRMLQRDQWALHVAHYTSWLTYWWNTQNCSLLSAEVRKQVQFEVGQQGEFEFLHLGLIIAFGTWEINPVDLESPFPNNEGTIHVWQGNDDTLVPVTMQRFISQQLPWIQYHELPKYGHGIPYANGMSDVITKVLLLRETAK